MAKRGRPQDRRLKWGDGWVVPRPAKDGTVRYQARRRDGPAKTFATQGEAEAYLRDTADAIPATAGAQRAPADRQTVAQLVAAYLDRGAPGWAGSTLNYYRRTAKKQIGPELGPIRATELTRARVQRWLDGLAKRYAPETIRGARTLLAAACRQAVALGLLASNPVTGTKAPPIRVADAPTWTADEVRAVLAAVKHDPLLAAGYRLMLSTGMRPGEWLGLRWSDVDLGRGVVTVRRTVTHNAAGQEVIGASTKGKRDRPIAIPPSTVAALRVWRTAQLERRLAAPFWEDASLVATDDRGRRLRRERWGEWHDKVVAAAGVTRIVPHGLRHSYATLELETGTHPKVVQERLGHTRIQITLDRYSHVSVELQRRATEALERALFGEDTPDGDAAADATTSRP